MIYNDQVENVIPLRPRKSKRMQQINDPHLKARAETGPLKINDDWTGLFIRGDRCVALQAALKSVFNGMQSDFMSQQEVMQLIELLGSTNEAKREQNDSDIPHYTFILEKVLAHAENLPNNSAKIKYLEQILYLKKYNKTILDNSLGDPKHDFVTVVRSKVEELKKGKMGAVLPTFVYMGKFWPIEMPNKEALLDRRVNVTETLVEEREKLQENIQNIIGFNFAHKKLNTDNCSPDQLLVIESIARLLKSINKAFDDLNEKEG